MLEHILEMDRRPLDILLQLGPHDQLAQHAGACVDHDEQRQIRRFLHERKDQDNPQDLDDHVADRSRFEILNAIEKPGDIQGD